MPIEDLVAKQQKIMRYIKQDEKTARELAETNGNIDGIRSVLSRNSTDDFVTGIVNSPQYDSFTIDVADQIMADFPMVVQEVRDKQLGLKTKLEKPKRKKFDGKKFKSKTKTGKVYQKTYKKWTDKEITFLKSRKDKPAKEVYKEYNEYFSTERSRSSLLSKFYRVR